MSPFPQQFSNSEAGPGWQKGEFPTLNHCRVLLFWYYSGKQRHPTKYNSFNKLDMLLTDNTLASVGGRMELPVKTCMQCLVVDA